MKSITCDLCGGRLQIDAGGQSASCTECGMPHSIERVREKLSADVQGKTPEHKKERQREKEVIVDVIVEEDDKDDDIIDVIVENDDKDVNTKKDIDAVKDDDKKDRIVNHVVHSDRIKGGSDRNKQEITLRSDQLSQKILEKKEPKDHTTRIKVESISSTLLGYVSITGVVLNGSLKSFDRLHLEQMPTITCISETMKSHPGKEKLSHAGVGTRIKVTLLHIRKRDLAVGDILVGEQLAPGIPANDCYFYNGTTEEYFDELFSGIFSEYQIMKDVKLSIGAPAAPVSYLFTKNNRPLLAVILCHSQKYNTKEIRTTMQACETRGIPVQRYFEDFRNKSDYVCERIRSVLK